MEISEKMLQEWQKELAWKFLYMMFLIFRRMLLEEYSAVQTTMDQILKECDFITLHVH